MTSTGWHGSEGPSRAGIQRLIALLPRLEAKKPPFDEPDENNLFARIESVELAELHEAIYEAGVVREFRWLDWQDEAIRLLENPQLLEDSDFGTIVNLLTVHVRKDRFCSGHLASMCDLGHVQKVLRRLEALRDTDELPV